MCLIALAWRAHPEFPLVVAGNRDEFFARPTAAADWWPDRDLLAGRDLRAGGTWMGVGRSGRFAALTNFRDPQAQRLDAPSRGALVGTFVGSDGPAVEALARIASDAPRYNGFNLLAGQWTGADAGLWIVSGPGPSRVMAVEAGVHALSNARLDTAWPKVDRAIDGLRAALASARAADDLATDLFAMLDDRTIAADADLPDTGIPRETERALSAAFIRMPGYGTRATTVLIVAGDGRATFVERRCEPDAPDTESRFDFSATRAP